MPPRSRKVWVEILETLEWQKEILASPPFLIPSDKHQKQKDKDLDSPSILAFFSYTRKQKKNSSIYQVDNANTCD